MKKNIITCFVFLLSCQINSPTQNSLHDFTEIKYLVNPNSAKVTIIDRLDSTDVTNQVEWDLSNDVFSIQIDGPLNQHKYYDVYIEPYAPINISMGLDSLQNIVEIVENTHSSPFYKNIDFSPMNRISKLYRPQAEYYQPFNETQILLKKEAIYLKWYFFLTTGSNVKNQPDSHYNNVTYKIKMGLAGYYF